MSAADLEDAGIVRMSREEIDDFLATQGAGVLGLPADQSPYLLPLSYGYDGTASLFFTYLLGASSRKEELTERAKTASFLVHTTTSPFQWQSVLLEGSIEAVEPAEYEERRSSISEAWRPDVFDAADLARGARVYRFAIGRRTGLKHTGLPPALRADIDEPRVT